MMTHFLRREDDADVFSYSCIKCDAEGELTVNLERGCGPICCPDHCGAHYLRYTKQYKNHLIPMLFPIPWGYSDSVN